MTDKFILTVRDLRRRKMTHKEIALRLGTHISQVSIADGALTEHEKHLERMARHERWKLERISNN